jgi:hypothetical protein
MPGALGFAALVAGACTGQIGTTGAGAGAGSPLGPTGTGGAGGAAVGPKSGPCDPKLGLAPPRLWRLNDQQYVNVVHDVFGAGIAVPAAVSAAAIVGAEDATSASGLKIADEPTVQNYMATASATAASAVTDLGRLLPCATPDADCVEAFIRTKVARAFRRPVTDAEVQSMLGLYQLGAQDSPATGVSTLLTYVLQAPPFLWRTELAGVDPAVPATTPKPLGPFELASALSFLFVDSAPDDTLWAKAVDGSIVRRDVLVAEVDRLMALPAVKANVANKVGGWLSVHKTEVTVKDPMVFPQFTAAVQTALTQSVQLFLQDVVFNGTLLDLVTSGKMYLNQDLAALYGVAGVTGSALVPVDLPDPQWRGGILTQPALLAANSRPDKGDPIHRGLFIYSSMVCGATLPPPPANAASVDSSLPADATERMRANFRESRADCNPCHGRFDPLGLLTERYDPLGRYVSTDASGQPIDQSATITLGNNLDGPANGLPDLITRLKSSRQFSDCASGMLANISLGRPVSSESSCALQDVQNTFAAAESFMGLFKSLATSPAFATRDGRLQ